MDDKQDRITIPKVVYQGEDKTLTERVAKFKAGTFRIIVFTIVGFIMGYFSHNYVYDTFWPTKLITAIPYKICEAIYVFIIGTDAPERASLHYWEWTEFFPHSLIATVLAETLTTVLIGGALYGALAYFTGDKRVFTLQRFLKFFTCWCVVILLTIGATYGINAKAKADNEKFYGDAGFFLYDGEGRGANTGRGETQEMLQKYFYSDLNPIEVTRNREKEVPLGICYGMTRYGLYQINYEERYIVTEAGQTYSVSPEFAQVVEDYVVDKVIPNGDNEMIGVVEQ